MTNTIFCNNCGRIIPDPDEHEVNGKYFCDDECEFEYLYGYPLINSKKIKGESKWQIKRTKK